MMLHMCDSMHGAGGLSGRALEVQREVLNNVHHALHMLQECYNIKKIRHGHRGCMLRIGAGHLYTRRCTRCVYDMHFAAIAIHVHKCSRCLCMLVVQCSRRLCVLVGVSTKNTSL